MMLKLVLALNHKSVTEWQLQLILRKDQLQKLDPSKLLAIKLLAKKKLLKEFFLSTPKPWSFFTRSDQYSKEKTRC